MGPEYGHHPTGMRVTFYGKTSTLSFILYLYYVLLVYRRLLLLLSYSHERRIGDRFEETNNLLISSWRYTEIAL